MLTAIIASNHEEAEASGESPFVSWELAFSEALVLAQTFGFRLARTSGSHHILTHDDIAELLNLQEVGGKAKAYQVRQLLTLVERYNLELEESE